MNKVKEVNFLGVILGETLSGKPHISQVASKVSKSVGVIHKSSFCLTRTALCTLYYSLIYSYLQYCMLEWGSTYPTHLRCLVLLQKRIIRIISKKLRASTLTLIHYFRVLVAWGLWPHKRLNTRCLGTWPLKLDLHGQLEYFIPDPFSPHKLLCLGLGTSQSRPIHRETWKHAVTGKWTKIDYSCTYVLQGVDWITSPFWVWRTLSKNEA